MAKLLFLEHPTIRMGKPKDPESILGPVELEFEWHVGHTTEVTATDKELPVHYNDPTTMAVQPGPGHNGDRSCKCLPARGQENPSEKVLLQQRRQR